MFPSLSKDKTVGLVTFKEAREPHTTSPHKSSKTKDTDEKVKETKINIEEGRQDRPGSEMENDGEKKIALFKILGYDTGMGEKSR